MFCLFSLQGWARQGRAGQGWVERGEGERGKGKWGKGKQGKVEGKEQEKGNQQRFRLSSLSSKLLQFFSKSDSSLYWYFFKEEQIYSTICQNFDLQSSFWYILSCWTFLFFTFFPLDLSILDISVVRLSWLRKRGCNILIVTPSFPSFVLFSRL